MENTKLDVNIEQIMQELRTEIAREDHPMEIPDFNTATNYIDVSLTVLNEKYHISYDPEVEPNKLKAVIKRMIRKLIQATIVPLLIQQNTINENIVDCLNYMQRREEALQTRIIQLERQIGKLEDRNNISEK